PRERRHLRRRERGAAAKGREGLARVEEEGVVRPLERPARLEPPADLDEDVPDLLERAERVEAEVLAVRRRPLGPSVEVAEGDAAPRPGEARRREGALDPALEAALPLEHDVLDVGGAPRRARVGRSGGPGAQLEE